jgi:large subunit ribosomal protein L2
MALKSFRPTTASMRGTILIDRSELHKGKPEKSLLEKKHRRTGHDTHGHISSRFRGGGHKRRYRLIDFKRTKQGVWATVERIEYDPNRTAFIALLTYTDGEKAYILAPQRLAAGEKIYAGADADIKPGNALPLKNIPVGTIIHNVELKPGKGGQIARSAGSYAQLTGKDGNFALVRLKSGEVRKIPFECMASIGAVSNPDHQNQNIGKAGRMRWLGYRPHNRGVSMNPVDHPHGGGEGKTSGGRHPVTPWGIKTKGKKTRKPKKQSSKFIISRRNDKKAL